MPVTSSVRLTSMDTRMFLFKDHPISRHNDHSAEYPYRHLEGGCHWSTWVASLF